jgi:hypothetical protein
MQKLNGADIACFMPYFLQVGYGEKKPVPIDIIFTANVKKNSRKILEGVKSLIHQSPFLAKELIDHGAWTKEACMLKNGTGMYAEGASDNARGYHRRHPHGKVIYFLEEAAFWGGAKCMESDVFLDEVAIPSMGGSQWMYSTPYGKRGGTWRCWNDPEWLKWHVPSWANPYQNKRDLLRKMKRLISLGRGIVVDQEMRGLFVDDAGLFFSNEIWLRATNAHLDWYLDGTLPEMIETLSSMKRIPGEFILGIDPNKGVKTKDGDPVGISITEKLGPKKYISRMALSLAGVTEEQLLPMFKLIFKNMNITKINFDSGGGYWKGLWTIFKEMGRRNIYLIDPQGNGIVEYMTNIRTAMSMGFFEMPESKELTESQQAMRGFGDVDEGENEVLGKPKFQTDGKKSGIPCDLCAMGLSMAKEKFFYNTIAPTQTASSSQKSSVQVIDSGNEFARITGGGDSAFDFNPLFAGVN